MGEPKQSLMFYHNKISASYGIGVKQTSMNAYNLGTKQAPLGGLTSISLAKYVRKSLKTPLYLSVLVGIAPNECFMIADCDGREDMFRASLWCKAQGVKTAIWESTPNKERYWVIGDRILRGKSISAILSAMPGSDVRYQRCVRLLQPVVRACPKWWSKSLSLSMPKLVSMDDGCSSHFCKFNQDLENHYQSTLPVFVWLHWIYQYKNLDMTQLALQTEGLDLSEGFNLINDWLT